MIKKYFHKHNTLYFLSFLLLSCSNQAELNANDIDKPNVIDNGLEQAASISPEPEEKVSPSPSNISDPEIEIKPTPTISEESKVESTPTVLHEPEKEPTPSPTKTIAPQVVTTPAPETSNETNQEELINSNQILKEAFNNKVNDLQVNGEGVVIRILSDDLEGSKHQRFILELTSGQTLLIAHNIDLAPKILDLKLGDNVEFYGEYEWNDQGGVIHWTHKDPDQTHEDGWLKHNDKIYQ